MIHFLSKLTAKSDICISRLNVKVLLFNYKIFFILVVYRSYKVYASDATENNSV